MVSRNCRWRLWEKNKNANNIWPVQCGRCSSRSFSCSLHDSSSSNDPMYTKWMSFVPDWIGTTWYECTNKWMCQRGLPCLVVWDWGCELQALCSDWDFANLMCEPFLIPAPQNHRYCHVSVTEATVSMAAALESQAALHPRFPTAASAARVQYEQMRPQWSRWKP